MAPSLPGFVQLRMEGQGWTGMQSWDRLCLVHQFIHNGFGNTDQCLEGQRSQSQGGANTHLWKGKLPHPLSVWVRVG